VVAFGVVSSIKKENDMSFVEIMEGEPAIDRPSRIMVSP
jgi:hypothetical protein